MPGVSDSGTTQVTGSLRAAAGVLLRGPERVLVPAIAITVPVVVLQVLLQHLLGLVVAGNAPCDRRYAGALLVAHCGPSSGRAGLAVVAGLFVVLLLAHLAVAAMDRVVLDVIDGVAVRAPFAGTHLRAVLPTAVLLSALLTVATLLLVVPALVLGFFTRYALLAVVDRGVGPLAAVGASFELVGSRLASELGFVVRAAGALLLGLLAVVVGLYVAVPVVLLAQAARYRAARPQEVAA
jgi:uncharacterized membrane protein